ncbi:MAG: phosphatase PAP2 family protein, partial [Verrucomicrobiota bacterium]
LIVSFQKLRGLGGFMKLLSDLGSSPFLLGTAALIYLCVDSKIGARLVFLFFFNEIFNTLGKLALHSPRPYWVDPRVKTFSTETDLYGMPSGHAQNALSFWLGIATIMRAPWVWVGAVIIVLLVSISRVYLGVHFISDVIAGWILGGVLLGIFLSLEPKVVKWLARLNFSAQILVALATSAISLLAGYGLRAALAQTLDPAAWAGFSSKARQLDSLAMAAGGILGGVIGLAMSLRWARFDARGPLGKRMMRAAIGGAGGAAIYYGLRYLTPREPEAVWILSLFLRTALALLWVLFLTPWLSLKAELADPPGSLR